MTHATDPAAFARRRSTATLAVIVPLLICCVAWAVWPVRSSLVAPPVIAAPKPPAREQPDASPLELAAFDAQIWVLPPKPTVTPPEPAPPPETPLKLKLVGILQGHRADAALVAVLYDPASDKLAFAPSGEKVGGYTVGEISDASVELTSGRSSRTLLLDNRPKPSTRGGGS
jgi:hypothetical protein